VGGNSSGFEHSGDPVKTAKYPMKYYIYISDAKVDIVLPQVPHATGKKVATEFGIDLKVLKATRTTEEELVSLCASGHFFSSLSSFLSSF
jgi:hypothetical protein